MATIAFVIAAISFVLALLCTVMIMTGRVGDGAGRDPKINEIIDWARKHHSWATGIADAVDNLEQSQDSALDGGGNSVTYPSNQPGKRLGGPGDGSGAPPPPPGF
jgi:hypothetical protein